jgi:hypothetical protein
MATKKKFNPTAAALTILGLGVVGFGVWQFIIKPRQEKKKQQLNDLIASYPSEVLDAQFEQIDEQTA